jgi:hypothetical protein
MKSINRKKGRIYREVEEKKYRNKAPLSYPAQLHQEPPEPTAKEEGKKRSFHIPRKNFFFAVSSSSFLSYSFCRFAGNFMCAVGNLTCVVDNLPRVVGNLTRVADNPPCVVDNLTCGGIPPLAKRRLLLLGLPKPYQNS